MFDYDAAIATLEGERDRCIRAIASLVALKKAACPGPEMNMCEAAPAYAMPERSMAFQGQVYKDGRVFSGSPTTGARRPLKPAKATASPVVTELSTRAMLFEESTRRKEAGEHCWRVNAIANEAIVNYLSLSRSEGR